MAVHEGGWEVRLDPGDRTVTVVRPDGTVLEGGPIGRRWVGDRRFPPASEDGDSPPRPAA